jgi:hypothetical protein
VLEAQRDDGIGRYPAARSRVSVLPRGLGP